MDFFATKNVSDQKLGGGFKHFYVHPENWGRFPF